MSHGLCLENVIGIFGSCCRGVLVQVSSKEDKSVVTYEL